MFERFTESARQAVTSAHEEAKALSHGDIGSEHLLLGLLREHEGASRDACSIRSASRWSVSAPRWRAG